MRFSAFYILCWLVIASLFSSSALPAWGGILDVIIAFIIVFFMMWFYYRTEKMDLNKQTRISYKIASITPAILLVILWLLQKQIDFNIALTGFAWRLYVLFQILPRAIYLWNEQSA
ncbi:MAG: hypothetical protein ABIU06_03475 [Anaerolineales bacterium]